MKTLREIIPENLIKLRKQLGLTQVGLAKKINFSDKAVSRWEKGEVLPDIETLENLASIFNVPLSYLLEEHNENNSTPSNIVPKNEIAFQTLMVIAVWTIATTLYVFAELYYNVSLWQLFVWAVPVSTLVVAYFNRKRKNKHTTFACRSIFIWTLIASLYLQFISFNAWMLFLVGIPLQAATLVSYLATLQNKKS
ncbi:MAG: helix-turn-helix transcriptional regulator [Clostridia bacterium]|nr:helix-turn-helix transcriptional regulator [Clostridia bacterium]